MPPLASSHAPHGGGSTLMQRTNGGTVHGPTPPQANKPVIQLQSKSAIALVKERRIEFVRAKHAKAMTTIDEATGKVVDPTKKPKHARDSALVDKIEIERVLAWKTSRKIGPGFANLGNTCYLNSTLQCLAYTPSFVQYLLDKDVQAYFGVQSKSAQQQHTGMNHKHYHSTSTGGGGGPFDGVRVMTRLLQSVHATPPLRVLQPKELAINIRHISKSFRIGRQEDAHEFFRLVLDAMQRSCLRRAHLKEQANDPRAMTSFIHQTFGGTLKNTLKCAKCQYISERRDAFLDLSLEIQDGIHSIKSALQHFTATETLDMSNAWKCANCRQLNRAEKGMTIETCPNVLVIQLKRFDGMFGKIKKHIEFGTTLDLSVGMLKTSEDRRRGRNRYALHGVLVHAGFSTNCGHYYAFVKGSSGQWYEMNDESVRWVSVETVLQQRAYMLFYSKVLPEDEQPPPKTKSTKDTVVEKEKPKSEQTKKVVVEDVGEKTNKSELDMNGFLTSLRTNLTSLDKKETKAEVPASPARLPVPARSIVTYKVSAKQQSASRKRPRLVTMPVFVGTMGRSMHYRAVWRRAAPLQMATSTAVTKSDAPTTTKTTTSESVQPLPSPPQPTAEPKVVVEKVGFNPRELRNFGDQNAALYGKSVDQWGGDGSLVAKHDHVLKAMKQEDWKHRKAQRKSSWDEQLDLGKIKKVKKRKDFVANQGATNAFQVALLHKKFKK